MTDDRDYGAPPAREPVFTAPLLSLLLPALLIALYAFQSSLSPYVQEQVIEGYGLTPNLLRQGQVELLVTHLFLHGSWMHVLANSAFCLAFAAPVVRACGRGFAGGLSFLVFYLLCGMVAGLGDSLLNWSSAVPILGASGAVSGLMGAAIRLRVRTDGTGSLAPLTDSRVVSLTVFWCGVNVMAAFVPAIMGVAQGQGIAWQAHIIGYVFGLLAIGVWLGLTRRGVFTTS